MSGCIIIPFGAAKFPVHGFPTAFGIACAKIIAEYNALHKAHVQLMTELSSAYRGIWFPWHTY